MTYTNDQNSALESFDEFLKSSAQVFLLKGYAGTGKTTLMKAMIDKVGSRRHVTLMAPTGRASVIVSQKTGRTASTIHRAIFAIEMGPDESNGKLRFHRKVNNDAEDAIYFVDESSMVSDISANNDLYQFGSGLLLHELMAYCGERKIVFVGDNAQLPPVQQAFSPALDADYLSNTFQVSVMQSTLREVVRQGADSGIYTNSIEVRRGIENANFSEFALIYGDDVKESNSLLDDYLQQVHNEVDMDSIVVTYTNESALDYNQKIRMSLFGYTQERLLSGDLLIISRNNYNYHDELFNGTIVKVAACEPDAAVEHKTIRFNSSDKDSEGKALVKELDLTFRSVTLELPNGNLCKCKLLDTFLTDKEGGVGKDYNQALMVDFSQRHPGLTRDKEKYYREMKKDPYLNAVVCKYGYAITCHKAQGGEWKHVFVDMEQNKGKHNSDFFRWAYTAITRSSKYLWAFHAPNFDFMSEMQRPIVSIGGNMEFYIPEGVDYKDWRFGNIQKLCAERGLTCMENRSKDWQHIIMISDAASQSCTIQLWYNKNGYSGKETAQKYSSDNIKDMAVAICRDSLAPIDCDFPHKSGNGEKLFRKVLKTAEQSGMKLMNLKHQDWHDVYFFRANNGNAVLKFFYNSKQQYSSCTAQCSAPQDIEQVQQFCDLLIN